MRIKEWPAIAIAEVGIKEKPGAEHHPRILEYLKSVDGIDVLTDEISWCSAFVNWVMTQAGFVGTNSPAARSWLKWGEECAPVQWCIVVLKRGTQSWQGHVGFFLQDLGDSISVFGGNQSDRVGTNIYKKENVLGYRLPGAKDVKKKSQP